MNGTTEELEVVISDSSSDQLHPYIYEGSFANIPDKLLLKKVNRAGRVVTSSVPERTGAYSLTI